MQSSQTSSFSRSQISSNLFCSSLTNSNSCFMVNADSDGGEICSGDEGGVGGVDDGPP
jgi:hypothetical protein